MYASDNREGYAKTLILPYVEQQISHRKKISLKDLTQEKLQHGLRLVLEEIADSEEYQNSNAEMA